ncbi:MAG TPA: hypothetical protein VGW10_08805 [Solirubrobacteraceae bacterium]|nr:hypothetical protein [Solirubrobacteraceae bacterium]
MFDPTSEDLARRGRAHTRLRELLDARGPAVLHGHERELLVDAADDLLFNEDDALERRDFALDLLDELVESGRWDPAAANAVAQALRACGQAAARR